MDDLFLSPAALEDEAADIAFHRKYAREMAASEAPALQPAPSRITLEQLPDSLFEEIGKAVGAELNKLRLRIEQLESQRGLKYVGPWQQGGDYVPGDFCSFRGSVWHCKAHTGTKPGSCPEAWQLAVKAGKDAR
jgi:hypothetical protein